VEEAKKIPDGLKLLGDINMWVPPTRFGCYHGGIADEDAALRGCATPSAAAPAT